MLKHVEHLDLLRTHRTHHAMIEFTRDCNMRCTYCAVSQPTWKPITLKFDKIDLDDLIVALRKRGLQVVVLHGHGETTTIDGWHLYAKKFQEAGIGLTTCSNLAREYTDEEYNVLSQFVGITVSLDTIDPVLFRKIRRGGDIRQIMFNQSRIQALARAQGHYIRWIWSCVVVDKTVSGLIDLVNYGVSVGVEAFCFCNLTEMETPEGGVPLRHLSKLESDEAEVALETLRNVEQICQMNGAYFDAKAGLMDSLEAAVHGHRASHS
jgi:MoaA/NifB/PqqE/SkfB family radical SAM enzyme